VPSNFLQIRKICSNFSYDRIISGNQNQSTQTCFIAFRSPLEVIVFELSPTEIQTITSFNLHSRTNGFTSKIPLDDDPSPSEIHSIEILHSQGPSHFILFGMRDGIMISTRLDSTHHPLSFSDSQMTKFGNSPVEFISSSHFSGENEVAYLNCEYIWAIRLENGDTLDEIVISEILFDDFRIVYLFMMTLIVA
jgi:hypothetical protein